MLLGSNMNLINEYIKTYIRQINNPLLQIDKIKIISMNDHYKLYYNSEFICYLDNDIKALNLNRSAWIPTFDNHILEYTGKKKWIPCLLCATNKDSDITSYIMRHMNATKLFKVIVIAPNNNFINHAIRQNIEYVISSRPDYKTMIQTGLMYVKMCPSYGDVIFISNTDTIIHSTIMSYTLSKFNNIFHICGQTSLKYINTNNNEVRAHNITCNNKTVIMNWFALHRTFLDKFNWALFNEMNMYDMIKIYLEKFKSKIMHIPQHGVICVDYERHNSIVLSPKNDVYLQNELQVLTNFSNQKTSYYDKMVIYMNNLCQINTNPVNNIEKVDIIYKNIKPENKVLQDRQLVKPITRKMETINEYVGYNTTLRFDKFYFIISSDYNIVESKIKAIKGIEKLNYSIIYSIDKKICYVNVIKDAISKKIGKIVIIDERWIADSLIYLLLNLGDISVLWNIILFFQPTQDYRGLVKLSSVTDELLVTNNYAICMQSSIFSDLLYSLYAQNSYLQAIFDLKKRDNMYLYYNAISVANLQINKQGKNVISNKLTSRFPIKSNDIMIHNPKEIVQINRNYNYQQITPIEFKPVSHGLVINQIGNKINKIVSVPDKIQVSYSNKIVQGLWIGEKLSLNEVLCIMSFIKNGHEFHLYTYGNVENIPKECIVKNGNDILPESEIFYYSEQQSLSGQKRPTGFSNMFRYKMLYDNGGYWVDMDMICIRHLNFPEAYVFSSESTFSRNQTINAGIIKCPKGCEFAKYCYEICKMKDKTKIRWGEIGPKLVEEGVNKFKLQQYVKHWSYFCPIGYDKINDIISPSKIQIEKDWHCLHLWNEFWVKNNWDKNKIYYGSLFGKLVNRYCREYVSQEIFNLEQEYGKYNKTCVLFYWMPKDDSLSNDVDAILNKNINDIYDPAKCFVLKEQATANKNRIELFIHSDLYVYMFVTLLEWGIIDNLHIIFGIGRNNKYLYNRESLFGNGNYYNFNEKICLWKLNDINSLLGFSNAYMYFYKGYGNHEHFYSLLTAISPHSIFLRYLATALPYTYDKGHNIVLDDNYVMTYADNHIIKKKMTNFIHYFNNYYANYDMLYIDSIEKIPNYKKVFPNTKHFVKLNKYSLMKYDETPKRPYDLLFCASDVHPSKNWNIFFSFLAYCENNKRPLAVLIITPIISDHDAMFRKYVNMKYVKATLIRDLTSLEMSDAYNTCNSHLVTFGRDANPRVMSESLSCGCYNIVLDILSDGKDVIRSIPSTGKFIHIQQSDIEYEAAYQSVKCVLKPDQMNEIYALTKMKHNHKEISETFCKKFNVVNSVTELNNCINEIKSKKHNMVLTLATEDYSNNLNYLLSSLKKTNPDKMVIVYCVQWRESLINQFKVHYPNYYFDVIDMDNYVKGDIIRLKVELQYKAYFKYKIPFVWIDADSIALKNLNPLFDKIKKHTLICYYRPEEKFYMKFAVGVIAFGMSNNNEEQELNEEFLEKYYENCKTTSGYNNWFYDQSSLFETYTEYEKKIKLYGLDDSEHSINDTPNTIVYSRRLLNKKGLKDLLLLNKIEITNINFNGIQMKYD